MNRSIFDLLMIAKNDCMIDKIIPEVITGTFISNLIPANQQVENNSSAYDKKDFASPPLLINNLEKNCKHRTETGFCKRSNQQCMHFIKSTLNIAI